MTKREIFENSDNLSKHELNAENNKAVCAKNDFMTTITKLCRGEKKKKKKKKAKEKQIHLEEN